MRLKLLHGRRDPREELDDWGFDGGTVEGIAWAHTTYHTHTIVGFKTPKASEAAQREYGWASWDEGNAWSLEVPYHDDMLYAPGYRVTPDAPPGAYFGDWEWLEDAAEAPSGGGADKLSL